MKEFKISIPQCIYSSFEYNELNEPSRKHIEAKLNYCLEVTDKINSWLISPEETLESLLDNLELDCLSIISSGFGDTENYVSTYQFHSSWTVDCQKINLYELVSSEAKNLFGKNLPNYNSSAEEIINWLREWVATLNIAIKKFIDAQSFDLAMASIITINSLLFAFLFVASAGRVNPNF